MKPKEPHNSMRGHFAYYLYEMMCSDKDIVVLTGGLGYGMFDNIKIDFPDRFYDFGACEHTMVASAVGMALSGKKPVCYSITPFIIYRPFEVIRNYIDRGEIGVTLVGGGRDRDYKGDGFSHWAEEDIEVMDIFKNIKSRWPEEFKDVKEDLRDCIGLPGRIGSPSYINLRR